MISLDCLDSWGVEYHCKCKKCGEEADVDAFMVLTSYPPQYNYSCPHCGERGYVLCTEAYTSQAKNAESVWEDIKPDYVFQGGDFGNLDYSKAISDGACMTVDASELCVNKPDWPTSLKSYCKCQRCGGDAELFKESFETTIPGTRRRYHCKKCGAYGYAALENVYYLKTEEDR